MRALPILLLAASLLALPWLLAAPAARAAPVEAPVLSPGDAWTFVARTAEGAQGGRTVARVAGSEPVATAGGEVEAWRIEALTTLTAGAGAGATEVRVETTTWVRPSDAAVLKVETRQTQSVGGRVARDVTQSTVFDAPCQRQAWPLEPGASWNATCMGTRVTTIVGQEPRTERVEERTRARVLREERVVTPAGAFDAQLVEVRSGDANDDEAPPTRQWFAADACQPVRSESPEGSVTELVAFRCASTGKAHEEPPPDARGAAGAGAPLVLASGALAALALAGLAARRTKRS